MATKSSMDKRKTATPKADTAAKIKSSAMDGNAKAVSNGAAKTSCAGQLQTKERVATPTSHKLRGRKAISRSSDAAKNGKR